MDVDLLEASDLKTRWDSRRQSSGHKKIDDKKVEDDYRAVEEYKNDSIKYEKVTVHILDLYSDNCKLLYKTTLNLLLGHSIHKLENSVYKDWMTDLYNLTGDDLKMRDILDLLMPKIELPMPDVQETKQIKIKKNLFDRITKLKSSYTYKKYSIAHKIGLICCLFDFEKPLNDYFMDEVNNPGQLPYAVGRDLNYLTRDVKESFEFTNKKNRIFFYNSSVLVIYRYSTEVSNDAKLDLLDSFIGSTLEMILYKQTGHILPEEAAQMKGLLILIKEQLMIQELLIDYYNCRGERYKLLLSKVDKALDYFDLMKNFYFKDRVNGEEKKEVIE